MDDCYTVDYLQKKRVYWITSYSYKQACQMSSAERKQIGLKMLRVFGFSFGLLFIYLLISVFFRINIMVDAMAFLGVTLFASFMGN